MELTLVDIWWQQHQLHSPTLIDKGHHLIGLIHIRGNSGGHKFSRIMSLKPASLIGHQRIGSTVRLIKAVAGKLFHQVKDIRGQIFRKAFAYRSLSKQLSLLGHLGGIFLTHCATQQVSTTQSVATHLLSNLHHLFLIENNSVGGFQSRLEAFMLILGVGVANFGTTLFAINKVINHTGLQRSRAKQGNQCHNIFKAVWAQLFNQLLHTPRLKLEHRRGLGSLHHLVSSSIV